MAWLSNQSSLLHFLPQLSLMAGAIFCLLGGLFTQWSRNFSFSIGVGVSVFSSYLVWNMTHMPVMSLFSDMVVLDDLSLVFQLIFSGITVLGLILVWRSREISSEHFHEIVAMILAIQLGMSLMVSSIDLVMIVIGFELVSILSYVLVAFRGESTKSNEAAIKYLLYGACASGVMIFGFSLLFGITGSTGLVDILSSSSTVPGWVSAFCVICIVVGVSFKMAVFPGHMWCPDVYTGAATPVTAFLSVGPKIAGFSLLIRFGFLVIQENDLQLIHKVDLQNVLIVISAITMTLGNVLALPQTNLKRLMAYSSIAHAGYLLLGVLTFSYAGVNAVLFYAVAYAFMNFGAFYVIMWMGDQVHSVELSYFKGMGMRFPWVGASFCVFLFSLVGLPPFAGFIGKFLIFASLVEANLYWIAIIGVLNSVVSLFYYARIIRTMYFEKAADEEQKLSVCGLDRVILLIFALPTLVLGLFWKPFQLFL